MPLTLIIVAICFSIFTKNQKYKKRSLRIALFFIFTFGNGFLVNEALLWWEVPATSPNAITEPYDVGIILTGGMIENLLTTDNQIFTGKCSDRFIQPLRLYKMGKLKKILISGGNTDLILMKKDVSDETLKVAQLLEELGVKKEDLILERKSKNTRENALFTSKILNGNSQFKGKYILFTSAYHMRRAEGCFKKAGLIVLPFGTAYLTKSRSFTIDNLLIPRELNVIEAYHLIHEMLGYGVYKLLGYV